MKTKTKKTSEGDELLADVMRYSRGLFPYDFSSLSSAQERHYSAIVAWEKLEFKIEYHINKAGIKL